MSHSDIRAAVRDAIAKIHKGKRVTLEDHDTFDLLGLDSLERMSLLVDVETALDLTLNDVDPKKLNSIDDYVAAIQGHLGERARDAA